MTRYVILKRLYVLLVPGADQNKARLRNTELL